MKTLTLPLKKKWFEMIKSGQKKEEYREMSLYWKCRFLPNYNDYDLEYLIAHNSLHNDCYERVTEELERHILKHFDNLVFTLGYPKKGDTSRRLEFKNPRIRIGTGRPEWGAKERVNYFCITWD
jgi:hypothetical protein